MYSQSTKLDAAAVANAMLHRAMVRRELQERSGLSHFTTWKACNARPISLHSAKKIAKALRCSLRTLLANQGDAAGKQDRAAGPGVDTYIGRVAEGDQAAA